jgi:uncharacterized protein YciI
MVKADQIPMVANGEHKLTFYVISQMAEGKTGKDMGPMIPDHKKWIDEMVAAGKVGAAGPFVSEDGGPTGRGMYEVIADSTEAAAAIAAEDPPTKAGLRTFEVVNWVQKI